MAYLDNAATSWPKPACVAEAMTRFFADAGGSPGRAGHRRSLATFRIVNRCRTKLARLIGASGPERIIHALNGTDALNMAVKGAIRPGDHVVFTAAEHNSVRRPLNALARDGVITVTQVPVDSRGFVDPDDIARAITPKTRLIACLHVSNVVGTIQPVDAVGRLAREHDCLYLMDAAQSAGVVGFDVEAVQADLVAFPCHKSLLGPPGTGALYVGPRARLNPWREGGTGADSDSPTQPTDMPTWMEAGSPNAVGIAGLDAALDLADPDRTLAHERRLVERLYARLADVGRIRWYGSTDLSRRVGVVSVTVDGNDAQDVAAILDQSFDLAVRPGLHCAPDMHRALGTHPDGTVRASLGPTTTEADVDALAEALIQVATADQPQPAI